MTVSRAHHGLRTGALAALIAGLLGTVALTAPRAVADPSAAGPDTALSTTTGLADSDTTIQAGVATTLTATVVPAPDGGTVSFTTSSTSIYGCSAAPVSSSTGEATCTTTFTSTGDAPTEATYDGNADYSTSSGDDDLTIVARDVRMTGALGSCASGSAGALVAVDYGPWSGPIVRGCDPAPTTGIKLLTTAGFTTAGDHHDGPEFLCRIGTAAFSHGVQYPTSSQDPCIVTPPAAAYWSYWLALKGENTWTYSPYGAYSDHPSAGEVEAWVYGGTNITGTDGQPTFTPNQVRAQDTASTPDLVSAVHYLTTTRGANGVSGGTSLAKNGYFESFADFADYGLTIDGAFALAATKRDKPVLLTMVRFLDAKQTDGSKRNINAWTGVGTAYASGGAVGKEALLAEVTGYDPRAFAGYNLITTLDKLICTKTITNECAAPGNYQYGTSTFDQALGVLAQLRAGDTKNAAKPIAYLESLQNDDGSWPSIIPSSGDSDPDSTAMAAMALALVKNNAAAKSAVASAASFLAGDQLPDGGFTGAAGDSTNSAALAIQGLSLEGTTYSSQISNAIAFLATQQNNDGGFNVAAGQSGSDVRASTQVVGGIVGTSFGTLTDSIFTPDTTVLTASKKVTIRRGHSTTLGVTARDTSNRTALAGAHLVLLARVAAAKRWKTVVTTKTSATGHAAHRVKPKVTTRYEWRYMSTARHRATTSKTTTVRVKK